MSSQKEKDQRREDLRTIAERLGLQETETFGKRLRLVHPRGWDGSGWASFWLSAFQDYFRREGFAPRITGSVEGLPVQYGWYSSQTVVQTRFSVALPGWPTDAGLSLRLRRRQGGSRASRLSSQTMDWPMFRNRYVWFDDADWDDAFAVKADEPDTIRLHLDRERRALIKSYIDEVRETGQNLYSISNGQLLSGYGGESLVMSPNVIVPAVRRMVVHAKAIVQEEGDQGGR